MANNSDFVNMMLRKASQKDPEAKAQKDNTDSKKVEDITKGIQEKLQKKK